MKIESNRQGFMRLNENWIDHSAPRWGVTQTLWSMQ